MRRRLFVVAFALLAAAGAVAQSSAAAPAKSFGAVGIYANVGSGWWGGSDFNTFLTNYTLTTSNSVAYSFGIIDRIGGNPVYFEFGIGLGGFTGGFTSSAVTFSASYFSFPYEMSLGLDIPLGKTIALIAQAGILMNLHLTADYSFWTPASGTLTGSLSSSSDFAFLALSIPIAAGIEITLSQSMKMDILALYELGVGDVNFFDSTSVFTPKQYWSNLTENQFDVRISLVFPFAPPRAAAGKGSEPSTGNAPVQR
jgi:hypothetical protein